MMAWLAHVSLFLWGTGAAFIVFAGLWLFFYLAHRKGGSFFFDAQDCEAGQQERNTFAKAT